jgi:enterochelin esterase family protein
MDAGCFATVDFDAQTAADHLGTKSLAYWIEGTTLRIAARGNGDLAPDLCCTFQDRMQSLAGVPQGLWGLQYNLPYIDESLLNLSLLVDMRAVENLDYHGSKAPAATKVEMLKGRTETIGIDSRNLGQKRNITIYTPPAPPPAEGYPVVYMADNSVDAFAPIVETLITGGLIRPVLLVGMDNGGAARNNEYVPNVHFDLQAYSRHEAFVLNEVMPLAEKRFHASLKAVDRMTYGFSSGGAWALSFGVKHHDLFDQVSAFAVAGSPTQDYGFASAQGQTLYLGAGAYDYFNKQTSAFCKLARQEGLTCHYLTIYSGHDPAMWEQGLIGALQGAFPAKPKP